MTQRFDPLQAFCFSVSLTRPNARAIAFCKSVTGLKVERSVIPYEEGGNNQFTHKMVGVANHSNLVLRRGFVANGSGHQVLAQEFFEMLAADTASFYEGEIVQLGPDLKPRWTWAFTKGWICKWEGPELDASKNELSFETIEIAHQGFTLSHQNGAA